jgi:sulfide dehydrogenase [flavocytochrome c] flavoprotein chain
MSAARVVRTVKLARRKVLAGTASLGAAMAASSFPAPSLAQARPKLVIIGGGPGGLSLLRTLVTRGQAQADITLVEPQASYTTCFHSNLHLAGLKQIGDLTFDYARVAGLPGVTLARDRVTFVDRQRRGVRLQGGTDLPYERPCRAGLLRCRTACRTPGRVARKPCC